MPSSQVQLREAVRQSIVDNITLPTGTIVESRYLPRNSTDDLDKLHIHFVLLPFVETETIAREIDIESNEIAIAIQQKVPQARSGDTVHDGGDNLTFVDEKIEFVESIKSLFRGNGALRHSTFAGYMFDSMTQDDIYEADHLIQNGVFTSLLRLTFKAEQSED